MNTSVRHIEADVVIVGAGPAGLAAARAATQSRSVLLLDDNPAAGGQIWRGASERALQSLTRRRETGPLASPRIQRMLGVRIFAGDAARRALRAETATGALQIRYRDLVLATGARELFLPVPGWTLPNVMGAGGLQAMVKGGLPIAGKRIVVAGSGPLLLAVADVLRSKGAKVVAIAEQAPARAVNAFAWSLLQHPAKLLQAAALRTMQWGIPYWTDAWPVACIGNQQLERVMVMRKGRRVELECDYLACGFGLVPNTELAQQMGCAMQGDFVKVNDAQLTSQPHVYCAGEVTGIGGVQKSLDEGGVAGSVLGAAPVTALAALQRSRARWRRFEASLNHAFALRPELSTLADDETIVCRCEDVTWGRIRAHSHWLEAKLHTRCGMGPCQGRICGAALGVMRGKTGWQVESIREPVFPVRAETLAALGARREENS